MTKRQLVLNEIAQVPEPLLGEVLDFVRFLRTKAAEENLETALASKSSLEKDWLRPEDDEAWQHL